MAIYQIGGQPIHSDDPTLSELLANIYSSRERPLCPCRTPGIEVYVAEVNDKYLVRRMPNSGNGRTPACDPYGPSPELSRLGQVIGSAIQENPDEDTTALKFDFALSKGTNRSAPAPSGKETDSVKTDDDRLTLHGTLHYLWEEAGFSRQALTMADKRSWYVIHKYLPQTAEDKTAKGASLAGMLCIPESFNTEKKNEVTQRRLVQMMRIATPEKGTRRLILVVGEVKELAQSRCGHKIVLKHLPDCRLMMNDGIYKRLLKGFKVELGLWDALEDTHLMMIDTFNIGTTDMASLEGVALICATENWIPFESAFEKTALGALTQQNRRFMEGMRYSPPSTRPLACAVASDTGPGPTTMYVVPPGASEDYAATVDELIAESKLPS